LQKKPGEAIGDLNQAAAVLKEDGAPYFHRSIAYKMLGKKKEADEDMSTAAQNRYKPDPWERAKFSDELTDLEARSAAQVDSHSTQ
jgi:hypothetical protein